MLTMFLELDRQLPKQNCPVGSTLVLYDYIGVVAARADTRSLFYGHSDFVVRMGDAATSEIQRCASRGAQATA